MTPFAWASRSSLAMCGTSENSAGWLIADPAASRADSARIATYWSVVSASAVATTAWATEAAAITRTGSNRSAIAPASGASATTGIIVAAKRADTAMPLPVRS